MNEPYVPPPVPESVSPELRRFLEEEFATIAERINALEQYNEDNP